MKPPQFLVIILFLISCEDIGKNYKWEGAIVPEFSRRYGTIGYDYGWNAAYSPFDEGIIVVGATTPTLGGKSDLWAIKTNNRGLIEWEKMFGGEQNEEGYDVISTSDGGFLFVGYTWSYGSAQQVYVVKTDIYGVVDWEKTYGGSMWEIGFSVIELMNGDYLITGSSNSPGISSGNSDIFLIKIDPLGNKIWEKAYGNLAFPNHEWGYDITQLSDEGFIVVGARDRYSKGSLNGLIVRLDKEGNVVWEKELLDEGEISETIYSISKSNDGNYYLCSSSNSLASPNVFQPKVSKMDGSGNIDWQRTIKTEGRYYHQFRATVSQRGEIIVVGSSSQKLSIGNKEDAFITKLDSEGNIIWSHSYGSLDQDDWGWSVFETPKNNIIFVGSTKSYGASLFDIYLVSTNKNGVTQ